MTLKEAIGVHNGNVDVKTGKALSHSEIYERAIELLGGVEKLSKFVPFPVEVLREKLKHDYYFNNTSIYSWDSAAGFLGSRGNCTHSGFGLAKFCKEQDINISCCEGICILKEVARLML